MTETKHDARIFCMVQPKRKRPYGWECRPCGKSGKNFATGKAALAAAKEHNGGWYDGEDES